MKKNPQCRRYLFLFQFSTNFHEVHVNSHNVMLVIEIGIALLDMIINYIRLTLHKC